MSRVGRIRGGFIRVEGVVDEATDHGDLIVVTLGYRSCSNVERHDDQGRRRLFVFAHAYIIHVLAVELWEKSGFERPEHTR